MGPVLAGRYELGERIGRGGHGEVFAATDRVTGAGVAVKLLFVGAMEPARLRREVAVLRRLRVPGVVRLLDEGLEGDRPFVVMERARGAPFPGVSVPAPWETIAPVARVLLAIAGRIHARGIVHRDLKPANVLVEDASRVMLLDFGLSRVLSRRGDGLTPPDGVVGTLAYLSPEQIRGEAVSPQTDLYAIGVMLYEALSGHAPHDSRTLNALFRTRLRGPPQALEAMSLGVPSHVSRAIQALLATEPDSRPRSVEDALRQLGLEQGTESSAIDSVFANGATEVHERALWDLFVGRDRLFHERERAAEALFRETNGERSKVEATLVAWEHEGAAFRVGERWGANEEALSARRAPGPDDPEDMLIAAKRLVEQGTLRPALAALEQGVLRYRERDDLPSTDETGTLERLLSLWVQVALWTATPAGIDLVLYELARAPASNLIARLTALANAAVAQSADPGRAFRMVEGMEPFDDPALERARQTLRMNAARSGDVAREEGVLAELEQRSQGSEDPETRAWLDVRRGRVRYRQGQFAEAAQLHERAADLLRNPLERAIALTEASAALIEAFDLEKALSFAQDALALLKGLDQPYHEARAEWAIRASLYRLERTETPDLDLVEAAAGLDAPYFEALICLTEAGVAFRASELDTAQRLAERASALWARGDVQAELKLLADALLVACGAEASDSKRAQIARDAPMCVVRGIGIQVMGLLASAGVARFDPSNAAVIRQVDQVPTSQRSKRIDVLSVREALRAIEGGA